MENAAPANHGTPSLPAFEVGLRSGVFRYLLRPLDYFLAYFTDITTFEPRHSPLKPENQALVLVVFFSKISRRR